MRLIDADLLIENATKYNIGRKSFEEMIRCVNEEPTAYDPEAVLKNVKNIGTAFCVSVHCNDECANCDHGALMKSIIREIEGGKYYAEP